MQSSIQLSDLALQIFINVFSCLSVVSVLVESELLALIKSEGYSIFLPVCSFFYRFSVRRTQLLFCENKIPIFTGPRSECLKRLTTFLHIGFTLFSVLSCVSRDFIFEIRNRKLCNSVLLTLTLGWFSTALLTGALGHLCVIYGRREMRVYNVNAWCLAFQTRIYALCTSHTDNRAAGACIHFNTSVQQAAVVWSRFAGIIRRFLLVQ